MKTQIRCPSCGRTYAIAAGLEGKSVRCPGCAKPFRYNTIGRYQILEELGRGGFGVVYRVFDPKMEREAAVKVLHAEIAQQDGSAQSLKRFRNEAKLLAQIVHPNILPLYEADQHNGRLYLVTALIRGRHLDALLSPHGPLDPHRAVALVIPLLEALYYVHSTYNICHRDVKPANVMVGDGDSVFLMDFGLAVCQNQDSSRITTNGTTLGTPAFMPPEQAEGDLARIGPHSDQYSAGIVLYYLLTGQVPFRKPMPAILGEIITASPSRPSAFRPGLDPVLDQLVLRALEKDPRARYPDCRAFAEVLRGWSQRSLAGGISQATPLPSAARGDMHNLLNAATVGASAGTVPAAGPRTSSKIWAVVGGVLLAGTLLAATGYFVLGSKGKRATTAPTTIRKGDKSTWEGE